jgi:hypothetical protein
MPRARIASLVALARAASADPKLLEPVCSFEDALERLQALPGFGPWTAQYWALRALRDSDAFPEADVGLLRSPAIAVNGLRLSPKALLARAERWRPWRAYAAQHLWTDGARSAEVGMSDRATIKKTKARSAEVGTGSASDRATVKKTPDSESSQNRATIKPTKAEPRFARERLGSRSTHG